jgi:hypothetical protein
MSSGLRISVALVGAATLGACATLQIPAAPAELQPPAGEPLVFEALAAGVQIYECTMDAASASWQWRFKGPEAVLTDRSGRTIGKHYAGPTWESQDGSKVVGELKAQAKAADANAIPLLLLKSKANSGKGVFGAVKSIQRLETAGGRAPSEACSSANAAKVARVQYTATYYFYGN